MGHNSRYTHTTRADTMARKTHPYSSTSSSDEESSYNKGRGTGTGTTTTTYSGPTISDPTRRWLEVRSAEGEMAEGVTPEALDNLMWWNRGLGALHFIQAVLLYAFGYGFTITITRSFPDGPPGSAVPPAKRLFDMDIGGMVGSFLLFAAVDHALVGTVARRWYESDLANGICRARWLEYSWSASLMMVLIAAYSGITSFVALINIAAANSAMILLLAHGGKQPAREGNHNLAPLCLWLHRRDLPLDRSLVPDLWRLRRDPRLCLRHRPLRDGRLCLLWPHPALPVPPPLHLVRLHQGREDLPHPLSHRQVHP